MKKTILGLLVNFIGLAWCAKLYWSEYDPLSNLHGVRREYTPFEKRLYGISGTADRDCGGEMNMCYEVQGKVKQICAIDVLGAVVNFPNLCEMLYSNCMMDKENWRYTDPKKCKMLSRRFFRYDYENPSTLETTSTSPYRAEMVKSLPRFWENRPNNYPYPGAQFPQNPGNKVYSGNPSFLSNGLSNAALPGMQSSQQNQGTASQYPAMPPGYPHRQFYSPPIPPTQQGQNILAPSPNMPKDFIPPMPLGFVPSKNNSNTTPPANPGNPSFLSNGMSNAALPGMQQQIQGPASQYPAMLPGYPYGQIYGRSISPTQQGQNMLPPSPNMPNNFIPPMPLRFVPSKYNPNAAPPAFGQIMPRSLNQNGPPNFVPVRPRSYVPRQQPKLGYDPKIGFSQPTSPGSFPQQPAGYGQSMRRDQTQTNIDQSLQINTNNYSLPQDLYGFPKLEMILKMMSHYNNMTARDLIRRLIELSFLNSNETVSNELQDQMTYELEKAYNNSNYKDVHKYLPLFNAPMIESQPTARRDNNIEMRNTATSPQTNEKGPTKYTYKMNADEKEVYDQGVDNPEDDSNDTFVPEIQVPNEYGDVDEFVDDLDIGF